MEDDLVFIVPKTPKALKRHRMTRGGRVYDPSAQDKKEWMEYAKDFCPTVPLQNELEIELEFLLPRPKSHFCTGKNRGILKSSAPKHHLSTPDLDNLVKFVLDAMNGYFYRDDSQIVSIRCSKMFVSSPGEGSTYVVIRPYTSRK
jgi:Holliday junction resolvase RusA-like endonuclease